MSSVVRSHISFTFKPARGARSAARGGLLSRLLAKIQFEIQVRRSLRKVQSFDDKMLRDIGLQRGGIEHALRHGAIDGATERLLWH